MRVSEGDIGICLQFAETVSLVIGCLWEGQRVPGAENALLKIMYHLQVDLIRTNKKVT